LALSLVKLCLLSQKSNRCAVAVFVKHNGLIYPEKDAVTADECSLPNVHARFSLAVPDDEASIWCCWGLPATYWLPKVCDSCGAASPLNACIVVPVCSPATSCLESPVHDKLVCFQGTQNRYYAKPSRSWQATMAEASIGPCCGGMLVSGAQAAVC